VFSDPKHDRKHNRIPRFHSSEIKSRFNKYSNNNSNLPDINQKQFFTIDEDNKENDDCEIKKPKILKRSLSKINISKRIENKDKRISTKDKEDSKKDDSKKGFKLRF